MKHVLVELHSDGYVKVYGPDDVVCRIINRPSVNESESGAMVDAIFENVLPLPYRGMKTIATGQLQPITVYELVDRIDSIASFKAIDGNSRYRTVNDAMLAVLSN